MLSAPIREVLDHWLQPAGDAQVFAAPPGFSGAQVFRVETSAGAYCLRRWPDGKSGLPAARILELHRWLSFLQSKGVATVAVPVASRNASTLVPAHGSNWQLEPWLPGTADFSRRPTDDRLRNTAVALARLHLAAEQYVPTAAGAAWFAGGLGVSPALSERRDRLLRMIDPRHSKVEPAQTDLTGELGEAVSALAPRIAAELEQLADVPVRLQPCLRDVWHDHILFTGDEVTGIIDPSAARTENVASDLSRLLGSLVADARARWDAALAAYSAVRPLSPDERRLIALLDRSGVILSAAHWLERTATSPLNQREWDRVRQLSQRVFALR